MVGSGLLQSWSPGNSLLLSRPGGKISLHNCEHLPSFFLNPSRAWILPQSSSCPSRLMPCLTSNKLLLGPEPTQGPWVQASRSAIPCNSQDLACVLASSRSQAWPYRGPAFCLGRAARAPFSAQNMGHFPECEWKSQRVCTWAKLSSVSLARFLEKGSDTWGHKHPPKSLSLAAAPWGGIC